jgi:hypothetical protein
MWSVVGYDKEKFLVYMLLVWTWTEIHELINGLYLPIVCWIDPFPVYATFKGFLPLCVAFWVTTLTAEI